MANLYLLFENFAIIYRFSYIKLKHELSWANLEPYIDNVQIVFE